MNRDLEAIKRDAEILKSVGLGFKKDPSGFYKLFKANATEGAAGKDEGYDPDTGEYVGRNQSPYSDGTIAF